MNDLESEIEESVAEMLASLSDSAPNECDGLDPTIPGGLVEYVRSITRSPWVLRQVLDVAANKVLRRMRSTSREAREARWSKRWRPEQQERTKRWLRQIRNEVVRVYHLGQASHHETYASLPATLERWQPDSSGALVIDEPAQLNPSFGSPGFLEQTPIQVLRWVHETWLRDNLDARDDDVGFGALVKPRVWDLSAGSGTSVDYFRYLYGCDLVASDLFVVPSEGVDCGDCRHVGVLLGQQPAPRHALSKTDVVITQPDIVLFDPPCMGFPGPSQIYGDEADGRDLAFLEREPWIFTVADVAARAAQRLAPGGIVSLLVRCGIRFHGAVAGDPQLLDELKTVLDGRVVITDEIPLRYRTIRNQTSLGTARVPAVHLALTRAT